MPRNACRSLPLSGWLLASLLMVSPVAAAEGYRLQAGDAIDFTLMGTTPLERRIMIGQDGRISIPMGGAFQAAGLTIDELRDAVVDRLKAVSYPAGVDAQGSTVWNVIYPEAVLVEVGEYRPVYVAGDVLTPSSQPFRSGLTVAQAVAVAGGPSVFRSRQDHSIDRAGLEEEEIAARTAALRSGLQMARIQAELDGKDKPDFSRLSAEGVDPALAAQLRSLELGQFEARRDDRAKARKNLEANIVSTQTRLDFLKQSQLNLEAEARNYEDEVKRVEALLRKGLTAIDRLTTAQRGAFLVSTRSLDTSATVAEVERELRDLKLALVKLDDDARLNNLAALQTTSAEAAQAQAKIEALRRKARVVSGVGMGEGAVGYVIARGSGTDLSRSQAEADTPLQPGDLVEVDLDGAPAQRAAAAR